MRTYHLPNNLKKQPFSYQEAMQSGLTRHYFKKLLQEEIITRIRRGLYQNTDSDFDLDLEYQFKEATSYLGLPSSICLVSALEHYSLTEVVSPQTWVLVPESKRSQNTHLRLFRSRKPYWDIGVLKKKEFWITSLERTLVDCLVYKKTLGSSLGIEALRLVLKEKKTSLNKVIKMAEQLKVLHLIYPTLEAFA